MNAVARMTPDPKYLAMKKAQEGTPTPGFLAAKTGNHVPRKDPTRMTKMAEMRMPMRPSKSLSVGQSDMIAFSESYWRGVWFADDDAVIRSTRSGSEAD